MLGKKWLPRYTTLRLSVAAVEEMVIETASAKVAESGALIESLSAATLQDVDMAAADAPVAAKDAAALDGSSKESAIVVDDEDVEMKVAVKPAAASSLGKKGKEMGGSDKKKGKKKSKTQQLSTKGECHFPFSDSQYRLISVQYLPMLSNRLSGPATSTVGLTLPTSAPNTSTWGSNGHRSLSESTVYSPMFGPTPILRSRSLPKWLMSKACLATHSNARSF